jgi:hypothetical protein
MATINTYIIILFLLFTGCSIPHREGQLAEGLTRPRESNEMEVTYYKLGSSSEVNKRCEELKGEPWWQDLLVYTYFSACAEWFIPYDYSIKSTCNIYYYDESYLEEELRHCKGWEY